MNMDEFIPETYLTVADLKEIIKDWNDGPDRAGSPAQVLVSVKNITRRVVYCAPIDIVWEDGKIVGASLLLEIEE